jgi:hypothetical protein
MACPRRDSRQQDGIIVRRTPQRTSATKSAPNRHGMIRWKQAVDGFADWGLTFDNPDWAHICRMVHLDRCLDSLRRLMAEGHTNSLLTAERAIDEYLAATSPPARREGLRSVQQVVQTHRDAATGVHRSFADTVNDYIEKKMQAFE